MKKNKKPLIYFGWDFSKCDLKKLSKAVREGANISKPNDKEKS